MKKQNKQKLTITNLNKIALINNGKCLSTNYINNKIKYDWICEKGHQWNAIPNLAKKNWCSLCRKNKNIQLYIEEIEENKKCICISKNQDNILIRTKLIWKCKNGHSFISDLNNIKNNHWCPYCTNCKKYTIEQIKEIAIKNHSILLSNKYINNKSELEFKCTNNHIFKISINHINKGRWCPYCRNWGVKSIEYINKLVNNKGGKCLSNNYIDSHTKLKFQCKDGHIWESTVNSIEAGHWCPYCFRKYRVSEDLCRWFFRNIFKKDFPIENPNWLKNPETNRKLHLDGYNEELHLAFEYNGQQHYIPIKFHKSETNIDLIFEKQLNRDKLKQELCKKNGINLIIIPYWIKIEEIQKYIIMEYYNLTKIQLNNVPIYDYKNFNLSNQSYLENAKKFALLKNGECLSNVYLNNSTKLEFRCDKNHYWKTTYQHIRIGTWCPYCARELINQKLSSINSKHNVKIINEK